MRGRNEKLAIAVSVLALVWVVAVALFYGSGGINPAGVVPSLGCLISVWGAFKGDSTVMWLGTVVVAASSVLFMFSLGFIVIPAAIGLVIGSILVSRQQGRPPPT